MCHFPDGLIVGCGAGEILGGVKVMVNRLRNSLFKILESFNFNQRRVDGLQRVESLSGLV